MGKCFAAAYPSSIEKAVILEIPLRMKIELIKMRPNSGTTPPDEFAMDVPFLIQSWNRPQTTCKLPQNPAVSEISQQEN
jgi:hypothetical protein